MVVRSKYLILAAFAAASAGGTGCFSPTFKSGFASIDPQERTSAIVDAARAGDQTAVPHLIDLLDSADPAERMLADESLRQLTGQDFGYHYYDPDWRRVKAAGVWKEWWRDQTNAPSTTTTGAAPRVHSTLLSSDAAHTP